MGQYTEGWGSSQRDGAVHRRVWQLTEGCGSSLRGGAVQRRVGAVHSPINWNECLGLDVC